jgi:hypothetical protein
MPCAKRAYPASGPTCGQPAEAMFPFACAFVLPMMRTLHSQSLAHKYLRSAGRQTPQGQSGVHVYCDVAPGIGWREIRADVTVALTLALACAVCGAG